VAQAVEAVAVPDHELGGTIEQVGTIHDTQEGRIRVTRTLEVAGRLRRSILLAHRWVPLSAMIRRGEP
jgi:hypothetical protein